MKSMKLHLIAGCLLAATMPSTCIAAPADQVMKPYALGHVWRLSFVKFRAGAREEYLDNLSKNYVRELEQAKRQGTILSYKILQSEAATPDDWNIILMLELKNMASLDTFDQEMDAATRATIGDEADKKGDVVRAQIRDYLGIKSAREIIFKQ